MTRVSPCGVNVTSLVLLVVVCDCSRGAALDYGVAKCELGSQPGGVSPLSPGHQLGVQ